MGKYTAEEINNIINLKGANGTQIDIFDLHGVLYLGNTRTVHVPKNGVLVASEVWDLTETYNRYNEHSIGMNINDFEDCETEEDVLDRFREELATAVAEKLV